MMNNDIEGIDLAPVVKEHFIEGDSIWLDIEPSYVKVYRKRGGGDVELVATLERTPPNANIKLDGFTCAPSKLDDFSGAWVENTADLFSGEFEVYVYYQGRNDE